MLARCAVLVEDEEVTSMMASCSLCCSRPVPGKKGIVLCSCMCTCAEGTSDCNNLENAEDLKLRRGGNPFLVAFVRVRRCRKRSQGCEW